MNSFTPGRPRSDRRETQRLFAQTFQEQISLLEKGKARIHIPDTPVLFERRPGMAYHFKPELFIQTGGETEFILPDSRFILAPGEICLMPRGVPHGEEVRAGVHPFENVVACFYNETVAVHVAKEEPKGRPAVDEIHFFTTSLYHDLVEYLNRAADLRHRDPERCRSAIKGLLLAELSLLHSVICEQEAEVFSETERVFRCQWLIRNNLSDVDLGVDTLASELNCSAEHLSRAFSRETGERIVEYITRIRLANAVDAIRNTRLSVKEVAHACGFSDANYFARVFRKAMGRSPGEFRAEQYRLATALEKEPKVVFNDREEYNFGVSDAVMKKSVVRFNP